MIAVPARAMVTRIAAVAVLVALVAGCSSAGDADTASMEATRRVRSIPSCEKVQCRGEIDGARYELRLPKKWNGTLLIYSHGYRQPKPAPPDFAPVNREAQVAATESTAATLLDQGYALIGSAYKTNGWAYTDGVKAGDELHTWFTDKVAKPDRVYVWGDSLGGLITEGLAEKFPGWVSGAAPMCGVLGGVNVNLDLALDLAYSVKTLLYPEMKLTGYASYEEALATYTEAKSRIMAATKDIKVGVPKLLAVEAILDGPTKTEKFDGGSATSQASAVVESALTGLVYGTIGRYDVEQRVGGNPSGNTKVDYASRVTDGERSLADLIAPGALNAAVAKLGTGTRVVADPAARRKAEALGDPTGVLHDPTITMHTAYDPLVLVQNETLFGDRVKAARGRTADLVQLYTQPPAKYSDPAPYGAGHCNFTDGERVGIITLLDNWVTLGVLPVGNAVGAAIKGPNGYVQGFRPGPWPASGAN